MDDLRNRVREIHYACTATLLRVLPVRLDLWDAPSSPTSGDGAEGRRDQFARVHQSRPFRAGGLLGTAEHVLVQEDSGSDRGPDVHYTIALPDR